MLSDVAMSLPWFAAASSLVLLVFVMAGARKNRVDQRLVDLSASGGAGRGGTAGVSVVDNPLDVWTRRQIKREEQKTGLKERMMQAGFYTQGGMVIFVIIRVTFFVGPIGVGAVAAKMGMMTLPQGVVCGLVVGLIGTLAPSFWLDHVKRQRQTKIRRALPDALDVMVVCLEGGLSLTASFTRVAHELVSAHPMLAVEFQIVERQVQLGRTTGQAVREFADRFDLEELRSMASVIIQAERIGSSVVSALTVFADTLRQRRFQRAEEMAQKAAVKLLFPTVLFIFPGIFVVILGPAAIQIYEILIQGVMRDAGMY